MPKNPFLRTLLPVLIAAAMVVSGCSSTAPAATDTTVAEADGIADVGGADDAPVASEAGFVGSYSLENADFGTRVTVTVDETMRTIVANALPDHETGEFPNSGNPNTITEQELQYEYASEPTFVGGQVAPITIGVAVNGVKFEPGTAETVTCESGERFRVEAIQEIYDLGLDFNNAHVQPNGEYHYHGVSALLADAYATDDDLVHIGFAADGYLIYFSKSNAYPSGYSLGVEERTGTGCVGSGALGGDEVTVDGTFPDGTYTSDWVWSQDTGVLDECNGVEIDGSYAYVMTTEYPYISRCLNGDVEASGPGGGAPPEDGGTQGTGDGPDLSDAAETLGVSVEDLQSALGGPPPDIDAAAATLGISVEELRAALPEGP